MAGLAWGGEAAAEAAAVHLFGSSSLLPAAQRIAESHMASRPDVAIVVRGGDSGLALKALLDGTADIAMISADIPEEVAKRAMVLGAALQSHPVAYDAVVPVVHPSNVLATLTLDQLGAIYAGRITNWSQLGGPAGALRIFRRAASAATQKALDKLVLNHADIAVDAVLVDSGVTMREAVAADPSAIGFLSLHDIDTSVKVLDIDGVAMSRGTILSGRYPFTRSFFFVTHGQPKDRVRAFLDYARAKAGQALLAELGLIAVR